MIWTLLKSPTLNVPSVSYQESDWSMIEGFWHNLLSISAGSFRSLLRVDCEEASVGAGKPVSGCCSLQVTRDGSFAQGCGSRGNEQWWDSGYLLKVSVVTGCFISWQADEFDARRTFYDSRKQDVVLLLAIVFLFCATCSHPIANALWFRPVG